MAKKVAGYIVIGAFAVAILILVYLFITKGYSGKGAITLPYQKTAVPEASPTSGQETEAAVSAKISLIITSPKNGDALTSTNATVKGKTTPGADIFVNDQSGKADTNGNFSISIGLDEGVNVIVVSANDAEGNVTQQDLNVTVASF